MILTTFNLITLGTLDASLEASQQSLDRAADYARSEIGATALVAKLEVMLVEICIARAQIKSEFHRRGIR